MVLGNPSKINPFSDWGSFNFSYKMFITISSDTNPPEETISLIFLIKLASKLLSVYPFNILRISSPVETWLYWVSLINSLAKVPLPTPGAPKSTKNF